MRRGTRVRWAAWAGIVVAFVFGCLTVWATLLASGRLDERTVVFDNQLLMPVELTLDDRYRGTLAPLAAGAFELDRPDGEYRWRVVNVNLGDDDIEVRGAARAGETVSIDAGGSPYDRDDDFFLPIVSVSGELPGIALCFWKAGELGDSADRASWRATNPSLDADGDWLESLGPGMVNGAGSVFKAGYFHWQQGWVADLQCQGADGFTAIATEGRRPSSGEDPGWAPRGMRSFYRPVAASGAVYMLLLPDGTTWISEDLSEVGGMPSPSP